MSHGFYMCQMFRARGESSEWVSQYIQSLVWSILRDTEEHNSVKISTTLGTGFGGSRVSEPIQTFKVKSETSRPLSPPYGRILVCSGREVLITSNSMAVSIHNQSAWNAQSFTSIADGATTTTRQWHKLHDAIILLPLFQHLERRMLHRWIRYTLLWYGQRTHWVIDYDGMEGSILMIHFRATCPNHLLIYNLFHDTNLTLTTVVATCSRCVQLIKLQCKRIMHFFLNRHKMKLLCFIKKWWVTNIKQVVRAPMPFTLFSRFFPLCLFLLVKWIGSGTRYGSSIHS